MGKKSYINTIFQLFLFKQDGKNYHQSEQMREQRRAGYNSQPETCVSSGIWRTDFPAWWNRGHVSSSFVPVTRFTQRQRVHDRKDLNYSRSEFHSNTWELVSVSQRKWRTCAKLQKLSECPSSVTHPHPHTHINDSGIKHMWPSFHLHMACSECKHGVSLQRCCHLSASAAGANSFPVPPMQSKASVQASSQA